MGSGAGFVAGRLSHRAESTVAKTVGWPIGGLVGHSANSCLTALACFAWSLPMGKRAVVVSGRPVDPHEAHQIMVQNGCRPQTPFTKSKDPWPSTCLRCSVTITPTFDSIVSKHRKTGPAPRGCIPCRDRDAEERNRLDEDELHKTIAVSNIKPLEPYRNNHAKWSCECLNKDCPRAGKPIEVILKVVRAGGMACQYCSGHRIDADVAAHQMITLGQVQPATPYRRVDEPWPGTCLRCHQPASPSLHDVRQGQGGCASCAPNRPLTPDEAWNRAVAYRMLPDDKDAWVNTSVAWAGTCMDCQSPVSPTLSNLTRGQGPCRVCEQGGFVDSAPGLVYLLQRNGLAKIGICGMDAKNTRLKIHVRNGWTIYRTAEFSVGLRARLIEGGIKRLWFKERGWAHGKQRGDEPFDGYTETVELDDPKREAMWQALTPLTLWIDVVGVTRALGFQFPD